MEKHISEADFEAMVTRIFQRKGGKISRDEIRRGAREIAARDGITIDGPTIEAIERAQVAAAEDVVIASLQPGGPRGSLVDQIESARVRAGEEIVIKSLRSKGLSF
jgi:hypothetical protein